jgi:hypothetical protein
MKRCVAAPPDPKADGDWNEFGQDVTCLPCLQRDACGCCTRAKASRLQGARNRHETGPGFLAADRQRGRRYGTAAILFSAERAVSHGRSVRDPQGRIDCLCRNQRWVVVRDVREPEIGKQCFRLGEVGKVEANRRRWPETMRDRKPGPIDRIAARPCSPPARAADLNHLGKLTRVQIPSPCWR